MSKKETHTQVTFQCPNELLAKLDELALVYCKGMRIKVTVTRTDLILAAVGRWVDERKHHHLESEVG